MANVSHASLTGSSLHEPKGVAAAVANTVYVANGSGSGSWVDINSLLTATNFTTGDAKLTLKTTADSTWIMANDGTIGDALSTATTRANADCQSLFTLLWTNVINADAPVSGGRGANAAADWAAHKTITLTKQLGRALVIGGSGSGLTPRPLGSTAGVETVTLDTTMIPAHAHTLTDPLHNHAVSISDPGHTHSTTASAATAGSGIAGVRSDLAQTTVIASPTVSLSGVSTSNSTTGITASSTNSATGITMANSGGGLAHTNVQPSAFWNIMVKL